MSIELHCSRCSKLIRAPESAAGKKGKCPYCQESVYIPTPPEEVDEIPLAPVDDADEQRAEQLRQESLEYAAQVSKAQGGKFDLADVPSTADGPVAAMGDDPVDVADEIEQYVIAMGQSKLDQAEAIVRRLQRNKNRSLSYIEGLMVDEMPPKMGDVPAPVMKGFLKSLTQQLKG